MANNVFGDPITDPAVTQLERAHQALNTQRVGGKEENARTFVQNLKAQYGNGVSSLCLVYNATGNALTFVESKDWYGHIYNENLAAPAPYPFRIQNGQWGAFLHVHPTAQAYGSMAAAVYRGRDVYANNCDYMMAWMHPWGSQANSVHTETREVDHFKAQWDTIHNYLDSNNNNLYTDRWNGCLTNISTGNDTSAFVEATFTLEDAA